LENNFWKDTSNVLAPDQAAKFYLKHIDVPKYIYHIEFEAIFQPFTITSICSNLREK